MFESGIKTNSLIKDVLKAADISVPISEELLTESYNRTEQLLYSEIIKEQDEANGFEATAGIFDFDLSQISSQDYAPMRYEDIYTVYVDDTELTPTNLNSVEIMRNSFCKYRNGLRIHSNGGELSIIYCVRPALAEETATDKTIKLPLEFVEMMRCKLKSDLYNTANDETNAAKWLDEYNNYLENFKAYLQTRTSTWGR